MFQPLKNILGHLIFNDEQKKIINECIKENKYEYEKWYSYNVLFPFIILLVALLFILYIEEDGSAALNMLLNGSLTILGISIIFTMLSYLLIREKSNESDKENKDKMVKLYDKIFTRGIIFIIIGAFLYMIQVGLLPEGIWTKVTLLSVVIIVLIVSIKVGIRSFITREDFYIKVLKKIYKKAENTGERVESFKSDLENN